MMTTPSPLPRLPLHQHIRAYHRCSLAAPETCLSSHWVTVAGMAFIADLWDLISPDVPISQFLVAATLLVSRK